MWRKLFEKLLKNWLPVTISLIITIGIRNALQSYISALGPFDISIVDVLVSFMIFVVHYWMFYYLYRLCKYSIQKIKQGRQ